MPIRVTNRRAVIAAFGGAAAGRFTFALVAKDLLLLPIEKITQITN